MRRARYTPICCAGCCYSMCGDMCVDVDQPVCCFCCNKDLCYETCWDESLQQDAWTERIEHKKEHSKEKLDPFDICSLTTLALKMGGGLDDFLFSVRTRIRAAATTDAYSSHAVSTKHLPLCLDHR